MYGGYIHPEGPEGWKRDRATEAVPAALDSTRTAGKVLHAYARKHGIPMHLTIPEGMKQHLRHDHRLDPAHAERAYKYLQWRDVPETVEEMEAQIATAIEETREP
jgi:hypothetical protein